MTNLLVLAARQYDALAEWDSAIAERDRTISQCNLEIEALTAELQRR